MCGIAGIFNFKTRLPVAEESIHRQITVMYHRGPDESGVLCDNFFGMGMRRLSIIDLQNGSQPMTTEDKRFSIVLNGEIYNYGELRGKIESRGYRFRTHSDTEVVLALFALGEKDPETWLRGMFAFAVYDRQRHELHLSRDRLGKKPLFWTETKDGILFGSEVKAILAVGTSKPKVNWAAISDFLTLSYIPGPQTAYSGIFEVPPATRLTVGRTLAFSRYWLLKTTPEAEKMNADWEREIQKQLSESVRYRLVSDVPVGLFLSGGMDSSIILSLMLENKPAYRVKTYTVGFDSSTYDEAGIASDTSRFFGVENIQCRLTPDFVMANFQKIVYAADNLLANPAIYGNFLLSKVASRDLKVILNGGGGDELFFGYPTYQADLLARFLTRMPKGLLHLLERKAFDLKASHKRLSVTYRLQKFCEGLHYPIDQSHFLWRSIFTEADKHDLLNLSPVQESYRSYAEVYHQYLGTDRLEKFSYADLMVWWTYMGLYQADTMAMANSIELRVPMMDHQFVELVYQIPRRVKFSGWRLKPLLIKTFAKRIPSWVIAGKKKGFHVPLAEWFCGPLREFVIEKLSLKRLEPIDVINPASVGMLLSEHFSLKRDQSYKINNLLIFVEWYHQFIEGISDG